MRKLLLSACAAAISFWICDAGAMEGKAVVDKIETLGPLRKLVKEEVDASIIKCKSINNRFLMISRWELGNISSNYDSRYLHIDYRGTTDKISEAGDNLTQEMKDTLYTLPTSIGYFRNLKVLSVRGGLKNLPDSIGNLENLRILDLSGNHLRTLPDSIGNLKNLEELYLSENYEFSSLPDSIGDLENLEILELKKTNLSTSLPESLGNLVNLKDLSFSKSVEDREPVNVSRRKWTYKVTYVGEDYSLDWYHDVINKSLRHWSCPTLSFYYDVRTVPFDLSGKNLKQIPFGVYMMESVREDKCGAYCGERTLPALKELDISNNQLMKIPYLLKRLCHLEKLYIHNNPDLNHLPDFLWSMGNLRELKIDGKLTRDLPKKARVSLSNKNLEEKVLDLTLAGKNKAGMSDRDLSNKTGPYTVYLKK
ncbi:MAG: leucine-rich repeat domain-containing protein [Alphaproteobacteria bacterium]|nr:leucine-rich repeat domain-containing protein [Alphaproteobacteria bacterium]